MPHTTRPLSPDRWKYLKSIPPCTPGFYWSGKTLDYRRTRRPSPRPVPASDLGIAVGPKSPKARRP